MRTNPREVFDLTLGQNSLSVYVQPHHVLFLHSLSEKLAFPHQDDACSEAPSTGSFLVWTVVEMIYRERREEKRTRDIVELNGEFTLIQPSPGKNGA